jgi:hypothetical protein
MDGQPKSDHEQYVANLEALVSARTEQLRAAMVVIERLMEALKPLRPDLAEKAMEPLKYGAQ